MVQNALRHGSGTVTVGAVARQRSVELHVTDEGPGFPTDFLPEAFERFSRADSARADGGAGLGLAIVDAIARSHGGTAHAWNEGAGANVWISLPREPETGRNDGSARRTAPGGAPVEASGPQVGGPG